MTILLLALLWSLVSAGPQAATATEAPVPWLVGCWAGEAGDRTFREHWTGASADLMLGVAVAHRGGRLTNFEFTRIARTDGRLVFIAQPGGRPPTHFEISTEKATALVFANPQHDFPKRVAYTQPAPDRVLAWIDGGEGSKRTEYAMRRVECR